MDSTPGPQNGPQPGDPVEKITWRMEMRDRAAFRPKYLAGEPAAGVEVRQAAIPCPPFNRFLYVMVGMPHRWGGRLTWGDAEWNAYVCRPELETWVLYAQGTPAGFSELERQEDGSVRIECFGLLPQFVGRGLGGHFLSVSVQRAWDMAATAPPPVADGASPAPPAVPAPPDPDRSSRGSPYVWLTTCSHDHPHARANYEARGFTLAATRTGPPNPAWPGPLPILGSPGPTV